MFDIFKSKRPKPDSHHHDKRKELKRAIIIGLLHNTITNAFKQQHGGNKMTETDDEAQRLFATLNHGLTAGNIYRPLDSDDVDMLLEVIHEHGQELLKDAMKILKQKEGV